MKSVATEKSIFVHYLFILNELYTQSADDLQHVLVGIKQATGEAEEVALPKVGRWVLVKDNAGNSRRWWHSGHVGLR